MEKQAHITYSGTVQGVGFRWTAQSVANSLKLTGWVKNCSDGTVEVMCKGEEADVKKFIKKIKQTKASFFGEMTNNHFQVIGDKAFDYNYFRY